MKSTIKPIVLVLLSMLLFNCESGQTLQGYYVDNQETPNFLSVDIPPSIIGLDESTLTEEQKKAFESVERLNFLGYKLDANNMEAYNAELAKIKAILNDDKYEDLIEVNDPAGKFIGKSLGNADTMDEFVLFVSKNDIGFGIIRVLGDDMDPAQIVTLVDAMKNADFDSSKVENIMNFYK